MDRLELIAWRRGLELSQEQAAVALGISRRGYQKIEGGASPIEVRTERACRYISSHPESLVKMEVLPYKALHGYMVRMTWPNGRSVDIETKETDVPAFASEAEAKTWIVNRSADFIRSLPASANVGKLYGYLRQDWGRARADLARQLQMFQDGEMGVTLNAGQRESVMDRLKRAIAEYDGLLEEYERA